MKKLLLAALLALSFSVMAEDKPAETSEAPKTKQVCKDVIGKDKKPVLNKDGSTKQSCKTIKIHKKYEGTAVPTTPPKK